MKHFLLRTSQTIANQRFCYYTLSNFFQPFDVIPHNQDKAFQPEEDSISSRLLTSYGVIRPAGPGTYHLLPLGQSCIEVTSKIERIYYKIREG